MGRPRKNALTTIEHLADSIKKAMLEYTEDVSAGVNKVVADNAEELKKEIISNAPKGQRKKYYKSIKVKKLDKHGLVNRLVYSPKEYRLTHLLERGHKIAGGGKTKRKFKTVSSEFRAEQIEEDMFIEGYFAVFNSETELWPGAFEDIASGAFDETMSNDIRALTNHDSRLVLGRNKAGTLELKADSRGLWGKVRVNPKDVDAVNLYERVKRGDVDQCSFGFNILAETTDFRDDGTVKWTLEKIDLHEVSICTFPAYDDTSVQAREKDFNDMTDKKREAKKHELKERLKRWL